MKNQPADYRIELNPTPLVKPCCVSCGRAQSTNERCQECEELRNSWAHTKTMKARGK